MKTQVDFRSSKFPPYDGEQEQINPGIWGKRLAEYLVEKLSSNGISTYGMFAEDWGWYIPVEIDTVKFAICCGHQNGNDDQFLCFTNPAKPIFKKWFREVDVTPQLSQLTKTLFEILRADPDIRDIVWSDPG